MLNLLPMPNGILNLAAGQNGRRTRRTTRRPSTAARTTSCASTRCSPTKTRASFKILKDRDDTWSYNNFTPGTGHVDNNTPGIVASSTITQVLKPTIVNEMNFGYTHNRWGFTAGPETAVG